MRLVCSVFLTASMLSAQPKLPPEVTRDEPMGRLEWFYSNRRPVDEIPAGERRLAAWRQMDSRRKISGRNGLAGQWVNIGPNPTITIFPSGGAPMTAGRVSALAVDPRNSNVIYAGAATGGVWKTTDGGANWIPLTDDQPSLATGSITLDPNNPDIVYVGTGEANFSGDSYYGAGILKSGDGGATWRHMPGPFAGPFALSIAGRGARIASIVINPRDSRILVAAVNTYVAASSGLFRSTDAGESWTQVFMGVAGTDLVIDPANPNNLYAGIGRFAEAAAGVYKSADAGVTWTKLTAGLPPGAETGRIALALARSAPNVIYAGIHDPRAQAGSGLRGLYRSADSGASWIQLPAPDYCIPQCWYNNVLTVHPSNPNIVVAGGLQIYRTLNGGGSWQNIASGPNGRSVHVDHHAGAFTPDGSRFFNGNDGGVYSTTGMSGTARPNWENHNRTLSITQFYPSFAMHPDNPNIMVSGTQDNGSQYYDGKQWTELIGCDGGWAAIDPLWTETIYTACQGLFPVKYLPQGNSRDWFVARHGMILADRVAFIPPYIMDPANPVRLYFGTNRVYQSLDGAGVWTAISADLTNNVSTLSTLSVSPADGRMVWAGSNNGFVHVTENAFDTSGVIWAQRRQGLPTRAVTQITPDPVNPQRAIVTFSSFSGAANTVSGHVFETSDLGQTWRNISGDLPNSPVNDLVIDPDFADTLYAGNDIGVFETRDGGAHWEPMGRGLPNTVYFGLKLHRATRTLRTATHGRGMWDLAVPLPERTNKAPRIRSISPDKAAKRQSSFVLTVTGERFERETIIWWNGEPRATRFISPTQLQTDLGAGDVLEPGRVAVSVFTPKEGGGHSNSVAFVVGEKPRLSARGFSNAATPGAQGQPVAAAGLVTLFGENLASTIVEAQAPPLPYTLGGVSVEVNGLPVPLAFVSPNQVTFQMPPTWTYYKNADVRTTLLDRDSDVIQVPLAIQAPGLFTTNGQGTGQGSITILGTSVLAAAAGAAPQSRPARKGEVVEVLGTGFGPTSIFVFEASASPAATLAITATPTVMIGGVEAAAVSSHLLPGAVGIYSMVVAVPGNAPSGNAVALRMSIGGAESNVVTMAIE